MGVEIRATGDLQCLDHHLELVICMGTRGNLHTIDEAFQGGF